MTDTNKRRDELARECLAKLCPYVAMDFPDLAIEKSTTMQGFQMGWDARNAEVAELQAAVNYLCGQQAMAENERLKRALERAPLKHSCACPRSSCIRKVLRREDFEMSCSCGLDKFLAELEDKC